MEIRKRYVVDDENRKVAVQLDMGTFEKIEDTLENYGLAQMMLDKEDDEILETEDAKAFYSKLDKSK